MAIGELYVETVLMMMMLVLYANNWAILPMVSTIMTFKDFINI